MAFKAVKSEAIGNLMAEGRYEVTCKTCKFDATPGGYDIIAFDFVVREDVDQPYKRKHIFKNIFKLDNGEWPTKKIGKYASSLGIENGQEFEPQDLEGRQCIVVIKHYDSNTGEKKQCIYYSAPTEHPIETQSFEPKQDTAIEVDDDMPF